MMSRLLRQPIKWLIAQLTRPGAQSHPLGITQGCRFKEVSPNIACDEVRAIWAKQVIADRGSQGGQEFLLQAS